MDAMKNSRVSSPRKIVSCVAFTFVPLWKFLAMNITHISGACFPWVLSKQDEHRLSIFERKILRRIYGPVIDGGRWRIRTNQELYQLCGENDVVKFCKLCRLRWAGHVICQDDDDLSRRVLLSEPGGKRPRGSPRLHWEDGVKEDAAKLGCRNWTVVTLNGEGWRKLLKEAEAHPGCSAVGERERAKESGTCSLIRQK